MAPYVWRPVLVFAVATIVGALLVFGLLSVWPDLFFSVSGIVTFLIVIGLVMGVAIWLASRFSRAP